MVDLYESIQTRNVQDYGLKRGEVTGRIVHTIQKFDQPASVIAELLQNAADAHATTFSLEVHRNGLVIWHDGRPFEEANVRAICSLFNSSKGDVPEAIGLFGMGFKSVFAWTDEPHVFSGDYHFVIRNFMDPDEVTRDITAFVHPYIFGGPGMG